MLAKLPIISPSVAYNDLLYCLRHINDKSTTQEFSHILSSFIHSKYVYLANSGISSFYIILKALKEKSINREVILPAYTAGSLVVAVAKAGLKPVLCDISLEDFNLDRNFLFKVISRNTLAAVCVHMFGIGIKDIGQLKGNMPADVFLIEDCAQSMGSRAGNKETGAVGDVSFFSFNRGKNLAVCGGGCIATNKEEIAVEIEKEIKNLKEENAFSELSMPFKILAFSLAVNPFVYGLGFSFISHFKDTRPPKDFEVKKISNFKAGLGLMLMKKKENLFSRRYQNGMFLLTALRDVEGVILPKIPQDTYPAFNRLPILFKDLDKRKMAQKKLWKNGIETSQMYMRPLHHMFNIGYKKEDFPNANYFAEHLLTLPAHPSVRQEDLLRMIEVIRHI